uniref:Uncharacterized protein n=1 Tax=Anguilla anguilla TaxID=7936 RepID=A0A0E9PAN6_ANGAN
MPCLPFENRRVKTWKRSRTQVTEVPRTRWLGSESEISESKLVGYHACSL